MRPRISTTVDGDLLQRARTIYTSRDADLFDAALRALIAAHEDQALAVQPYTIDLSNVPHGTSAATPLDDYDDEPPADVIEHFRSQNPSA
jgi:hypothetical protein